MNNEIVKNILYKIKLKKTNDKKLLNKIFF